MNKSKLDVEFVRQKFPSLTTGKYKDVAFFENAGGTYVPHQVLDHLNRFLIEAKVQPYGPYAMSEQGTIAIESATIKMAEMVNADQSEVMIGHSTTMNLYVLANALENSFEKGDEIIVTDQDHESNISPWRRLARSGVIIKQWSLNESTGELDTADLEQLLTKKTRLVCMPHSSNIVGSINDAKQVSELVHHHDALLLVDGVSYAPHHSVDVNTLGIDIYVLSLYKVFGPHLGLMFVSERLHDQLTNQSLEFMPELYRPLEKPGSPNFLRIALNPGYVNHEEVASLLGLVEYFEELHQHHFIDESDQFTRKVSDVFNLIDGYQADLSKQFLSIIDEFPALSLIGKQSADMTQRSPTFSIKINSNQSPHELAQALGDKNIAVQSGCFYAWRCLKALGVDPSVGVMRISLAHFNTSQELEKLRSGLSDILN